MNGHVDPPDDAASIDPSDLPGLAELPPELLGCVSNPTGGLLVIVTGAGSSMEWPTGLSSGADYSELAFNALVSDTLLKPEACAKPRDLSVLADAVFDAYGSQAHLTDRLPRAPWRNASPNEGHRVAAALLIDGVVRSIVTLNYDMAFQTALSELGAPTQITIAKGPEDHSQLSGRSLIYLHRSAESEPETWVLRKADLDHGWQHGWEAMTAAGFLSAPFTIFAGLGSPAAVLTETVSRLAGLGSTYYLADPIRGGDFELALKDHLSGVLEMGWVALMRKVSVRVSGAHAKELEMSARSRARAVGISADGVETIFDTLGELGIVGLGQLRSAWLLHERKYCPREGATQAAHLSDLVLMLNSATQTLDADLEIDESGACRILLRDTQRSILVQCVHAMGLHNSADVLSRLEMRDVQRVGSARSRVVIAAGLVPDVSGLPGDLVEGDSDTHDLVRGPDSVLVLNALDVTTTLRGDRDRLLDRLVS
jgi:hypothetical protein